MSGDEPNPVQCRMAWYPAGESLEGVFDATRDPLRTPRQDDIDIRSVNIRAST